MASTIDLYRLLGTYRSERERDPAEPPLDAAARVVAWAGDRLDREAVGELVRCGRSARGLGLSPDRDRATLESAGLVEYERHLSPWETLHADVAAGRRTLRDLTRADYDLWNVDWLPDECGLSPAHLIILGGWIPIGIVALVAGIVVAVISGDGSLILGTALGGTIAGHVGAVGAVVAYVALDDRWLRLGHQVNAAFVVFLSVGSAVALLVAVLVVDYGLGLDLAAVLDSTASNYRIVLWPVLLVLALRAIARQLRQ